MYIFCNKCGAENTIDAKYCQECGNEIKNKQDQGLKSDLKVDEKSPLGAAALNLLIAGAGFVYIHEYAKAVLSFIIVLFVGIIGVMMGISFFGSILSLFFVMAWSYDETKKYNKNL